MNYENVCCLCMFTEKIFFVHEIVRKAEDRVVLQYAVLPFRHSDIIFFYNYFLQVLHAYGSGDIWFYVCHSCRIIFPDFVIIFSCHTCGDIQREGVLVKYRLHIFISVDGINPYRYLT